jgi:hypothetical protein
VSEPAAPDGAPFVPADFAVPVAHRVGRFHLEPLGPRHNAADHAAWSTSIGHIHATPGFELDEWDGDEWPFEMTLEENLADLCRHAEEFARREAFAYTVLAVGPRGEPTDEVMGCVYVDPDADGPADAKVRSWVRHDLADLDDELAGAVRDWISGEWPFASVRFPGRPG